MGMHWTQHPENFTNNLQEYATNKAIVFNGLDFLGIFWHLMRKNYDVLAKYAVNINNSFSSDAEFISLMKRRLAPIRH
jgi:hypothetical protein